MIANRKILNQTCVFSNNSSTSWEVSQTHLHHNYCAVKRAALSGTCRHWLGPLIDLDQKFLYHLNITNQNLILFFNLGELGSFISPISPKIATPVKIITVKIKCFWRGTRFSTLLAKIELHAARPRIFPIVKFPLFVGINIEHFELIFRLVPLIYFCQNLFL